MTWLPISEAPLTGQHIRVQVLEGKQYVELPWLVHFTDGRWRYGTTGAPLHSWHIPKVWSDAPLFYKQEQHLLARRRAAFGSPLMPSWPPREARRA